MAKNSPTSSTEAVAGKSKKTGEVVESKAAASPIETTPAAKTPVSPTATKPAAEPPVAAKAVETPPAAEAAPKPRAKAPAKKAESEGAKPKAAPKRASTRKAGAETTASGTPSQVEIDAMISEAAYYLAEKRNFAPGYEAEDWELARAQVMGRLAESKAKA